MISTNTRDPRDPLAAAAAARAEGRVDDEIEHLLRAFLDAAPDGPRPIERLERAAHLICDLRDSLRDPTSGAEWQRASRYAAARTSILEWAILELTKAAQPERAFALSQRAKSPTLVRRLRARAAARPDLSPSARRALELFRAEHAARSELREEQRRGLPGEESARRFAAIASLQEERLALEKELRRERPEELAALGGVLDPEVLITAFPADESACWVDMFFTQRATVFFLVARKGDRVIVNTALHVGFTLGHLAELTKALYSTLGGDATVGSADLALHNLGRVLQRDLIGEIDRILRGRRHWQITFVPHLMAHVLPLQLTAVVDSKEGKDLLFERFAISYAPCIQLAFTTALRSRPKGFVAGTMPARLFANPTGDLPGAEPEQEAIEERLASHPFLSAAVPSKRLVGADVSPDAVERGIEEAPLIALACHARFTAADPFGSGLWLAGADGAPALWTVDRIYSLPPLRGSPVVVLSACESGGVYHDDRDEVVALPPAFVTIGAGAVLASLWPVEDLAASFLVERFVHHLLDPAASPATALGEACSEMRRLPREEVVKRCDQMLDDLEEKGLTSPARRESYLHISAVRRRIEAGSAFPYASPVFWGGFFVTGCGWREIGGLAITARRPGDLLRGLDATMQELEGGSALLEGRYPEAEAALRKAIPGLGGRSLAQALLHLGECLFRRSLVAPFAEGLEPPTPEESARLAEATKVLRQARELFLAESDTASADTCTRLERECAALLEARAPEGEP